jgi:hypothetical protein
MAIARSEKCGRPTKNIKPPPYSEKRYFPVGHPNSGVVCGTVACENDAVIWLKADEELEYEKGQRVFGIHTHTAKVRVQ